MSGKDPHYFTDAAKLLNKYKDIHPIDLIEDINERIGALFAKLADMNEDEVEEKIILNTFFIWLEDTVKLLSEADKGFRNLIE